MSLSTSQYRLPNRNGSTSVRQCLNRLLPGVLADCVRLAAILNESRAPQPQLAGLNDKPAAMIAEGVGELLHGA